MSDSGSDSDEPAIKKLKKTSKKPIKSCPYGATCYRKNPQHFKEFSHPVPSKNGKGRASTVAGVSANDGIDVKNLPPCPFGANCYRKNLLHFAEFSHPVKGGGPLGLAAAFAEDESGDDTEEYSDEDNAGPSTSDGKKKELNRIQNRPVKMEKTYSKMTEEERKDLIERALEAKNLLEKQLEDTKNQMEEKEKAIQRLQNEVSSGVLLMVGEKDALEGNETKYFNLTAERSYKEGSASQAHFRLAESQFYRLLSGSQYRISKVEYVVNPKLSKKFKTARENLKNRSGENLSYPVLAFHGTAEGNIQPICESGFKVPGECGFKHSTDTGYYGKGVYFSEYPSYSIAYIKGATKLMLCQVLPGKVFQCTALIHGHPLKTGYDSHTSPNKKELVIFNRHHILPSYIVHYRAAISEFKYIKPVEERRKLEDTKELMKLYMQATKAKKSTKLTGKTFEFKGKLCDTHYRLGELVQKHSGVLKKGKKGAVIFNMFTVSSEEAYMTSPQTPATIYPLGSLITNGPYVVREEFLYDAIVGKETLEPEDYAFE